MLDLEFDDAFVMQCTEHKEQFLHHINKIHSVNKFTVEDTRKNGSMPFVDILVTQEQNGTVTISSYRKPTILTNTCTGTAITT